MAESNAQDNFKILRHRNIPERKNESKLGDGNLLEEENQIEKKRTWPTPGKLTNLEGVLNMELMVEKKIQMQEASHFLKAEPCIDSLLTQQSSFMKRTSYFCGVDW